MPAQHRAQLARWLELVYWVGCAVSASYAASLPLQRCSDLAWWLSVAQLQLWSLIGYRWRGLCVDRPARMSNIATLSACLGGVILFAWPALGIALVSECEAGGDAPSWVIGISAAQLCGGTLMAVDLMWSCTLRAPQRQRWMSLAQMTYDLDTWGRAVPRGLERPIFNEPTCVVCLEAYAQGEVIKFMPCGHHFHAGCVQEWLALHDNCPTCRFELPV